MKKLILVIVIAAVGLAGAGSVSAQGVINGAYIKEHIPTKQMIKYTYLREADVMWEKRVWRRIDLREKMNFTLYYPLEPISDDRMSLWDALIFNIYNNRDLITVYEPNSQTRAIAQMTEDGDQFKYPVVINDVDKYKEYIDGLIKVCEKPTLQIKPDPDDRDTWYDSLDATGVPVVNPDRNTWSCDSITSDEIVAWDIKEDWFFDKQRSVMDVRIIGISPVVYYSDPNTKQVIGTKNLFWLYFPQIRPIIQNYFVYNRKNDAQRMSYDDLFWKRSFSSYITKESSIYDRTINDYTSGVDALLESERIKKEMMEIEHDVWEF
jgi:gliding motility associated protien GldN